MMKMTKRRLRAGCIGLAGALLMVAPAIAGKSVISHADGSRTELHTNASGTQVRVYDKSGKLVSKSTDANLKQKSGHSEAIKKYSGPNDKVSTDWRG